VFYKLQKRCRSSYLAITNARYFGGKVGADTITPRLAAVMLVPAARLSR